MPCQNPDHIHRHLWIPAWTGPSTFIIPPSSPSASASASTSDSPSENAENTDSPASRIIVITLERCERVCGFCPLNARQAFGSTAELVRHVHEGHPEKREEGVVVRVAPAADRGEACGSEIRRDTAGAGGSGIRRNTTGVAMRDADKKWRYENGDYVRR